MNRKQRRERERNPPTPEENLSEKIFMFNKLPEACTTCKKTFDKRNKAMVQSWKVVVRESEKTVRLFCPECCKKVNEVLNDNETTTD